MTKLIKTQYKIQSLSINFSSILPVHTLSVDLKKMIKNLKNHAKSLMLLLFIGCASSSQMSLDNGPFIYEIKNKGLNVQADKEAQAVDLGAELTGYIQPNRSIRRQEFIKAYPIQTPSKQALKLLRSHNHNIRVGQAIAMGVDFDPRTAGYLKGKAGEPISVTGIVSFERESNSLRVDGMLKKAMGHAEIANGLEEGNISGEISGASDVASGIHSNTASHVIRNMSRATHYGERVESTTLISAHVLPGCGPIGPDGRQNTRLPAVIINDGIIKRVMITQSRYNPNSNETNRFIFIQTS